MQSNNSTREALKIAALRDYELNSSSKRAYESLTALAASLCRAPMVVLTLEGACQWFSSTRRLKHAGTVRQLALSTHPILGSNPMIVPDALEDKRFAQNPCVLQPPKIRFLAGFPLLNQKGVGLGALWVMDWKPRKLPDRQSRAMELLSRQIIAIAELGQVSARLADVLSQLKTLHGLLPICARCKRIRDDKGYWRQVEAYIQANTQADFTHGICPKCIAKVRLEPQPRRAE